MNPIQNKYTIIGAGRLATALATTLGATGLVPDLVASRNLHHAKRLAMKFPSADAVAFKGIEAITSRLVIISVSDDALTGVAEHLAKLPVEWSEAIVLHTSGSWSSEVLKPLSELGASTASFHPVQTFTEVDSDGKGGVLFSGLPIAVEGDKAAVVCAGALAERLQAVAFRIDPAKKTLFHASAVVSSNFLVTLLALANELVNSTFESGKPPIDLFRALTQRAIDNALNMGPEAALTGPIVRGDIRVLEAHLVQLSKNASHLVPVYAALATETVRLAANSGRIDHEISEVMLDTISRHLDAYTDGHGESS